MEFLADFWLPIVVSAVGVFIVSSIIHMATPMHKADWRKLPDEEENLKSLRDAGIKPDMYMFPSSGSMKDMNSPEYLAKCERGPVGYIVILPNEMWNIGKSLGQWFAFSVLISVFTAYVAGFALMPMAGAGEIFRLTATVATMGYAFANFPDSIWKGCRWSVTMRFVVDGLFYGLTTGAVFAWLA